MYATAETNKNVRLNENDLVPYLPSFIAAFSRVSGMRYCVGMVKFEWFKILIGLLGRGGYFIYIFHKYVQISVYRFQLPVNYSR